MAKSWRAYCVCSSQRRSRTPGGLSAFCTAARTGTVDLHTSETTWRLSNKRALAWLWGDRELLASQDRLLVEKHLPPTVDLDVASQGFRQHLLRSRSDWVLKPQYGFGGSGVTVGFVTDREWALSVRDCFQSGRYVGNAPWRQTALRWNSGVRIAASEFLRRSPSRRALSCSGAN